MGHPFDLESLTLGLGLAGTGMSIWGLLSAITDLNYLTAVGLNGARRIVAVNNIMRQAFRMAIQVVIIGAGSFAVQNQDYAHESHTPMMLTFIAMIAGLVFSAEVIDRVRRVQLNHLYDRNVMHLGRRKTDAILAAVVKQHEEPVHSQSPGTDRRGTSNA